MIANRAGAVHEGPRALSTCCALVFLFALPSQLLPSHNSCWLCMAQVRVARGVPLQRKGPSPGSDEAIARRLWGEFVQFCAHAARPPSTPDHVAFADYVRWELEL